MIVDEAEAEEKADESFAVGHCFVVVITYMGFMNETERNGTERNTCIVKKTESKRKGGWKVRGLIG